MSSIKLNSGQRINKWTLLKQEYFTQKGGKKVLKWLCRCECGIEALVTRTDLLRGKSTKCRACNGCMPKDLSGKTFGKWKVISCDIKKFKRRYCKCRCSCGKLTEVAAQTLNNGTSTRCVNCYFLSKDGSNYTGHPLYSIWATMIARCHNENHRQYFNYGKRGILVCDSWRNFNNFVKDMYPRTSIRHSLDRINNNKGYYKENCRWATWEQQANNRRNNHLESHNGITKTLTQWAKKLNVSGDTLYHFLVRNSFECAYNFFSNKDWNTKIINAKNKDIGCSLTKWYAKDIGIKVNTLSIFIKKGNTINDAYKYYSIDLSERKSIVSSHYEYDGKKIRAQELAIKLNMSLGSLVIYLHTNQWICYNSAVRKGVSNEYKEEPISSIPVCINSRRP